MNRGDICHWSLRELTGALKQRRVSAREVMQAHLAQIRRWNGKVNAIVAMRDEDACLAAADGADAALERGDGMPPALHGIPWAFKELEPVVGFPWTRGSGIFRDSPADADSVLVERLKAAGVIAIGKTNVPEFGMGSHTYNQVYGTTFNPYDLSKSAGGSSGGAGAAVACGMLPAADGSDLGGSLRNPGNFNNVVGFRPSVGLVPNAPGTLPFLGFLVKGPIARTVDDAALLLSLMAGEDARDPACFPSQPHLFRELPQREFRGTRVAWCPDLGGLPLDRRVRRALESQRQVFEQLGCVVEEAAPDLADADEIFLTLRSFRSFSSYAPLLGARRNLLKPEAVQEIEAGARLSGAQISSAMLRHGELLERMRKFHSRYPFMLCAVNQLPPFDAALDWPRQIEDRTMHHYVEWMQSAYWISATFNPAISVPAGFTDEGLPVGLQIVGRFRDDLGVLQLARAFEAATNFGARRPKLPA